MEFCLSNLLGNYGLDADGLKCVQSAFECFSSAEKVGRPHYGQVLGGHPGLVAALGHLVQVAGQVLQRPEQ